MGTLRIRGISFRFYPDDHYPRHVHARYAETEAIVELREDGTAKLAERTYKVLPLNAKRNDTVKILSVAQDHFDVLVLASEEMHP